MAAAQRAAAAAAHAAASPPGSGGGPLPYVCNWVAGEKGCMCGFNLDDALLQQPASRGCRAKQRPRRP
jgi:hypothetical protein